MRSNTILISAVLAALVGCGGGQKTGLKGGSPPPPPKLGGGGGGNTGPEEPKREISNDAKKDYEAALNNFLKNDKGGAWSESACRSSADQFSSVARQHSKVIEAQFMAGLSYQRCKLNTEAEKAYQGVIAVKPNHGQSLSNLGQMYYDAGKVADAKKYWETAIQANGKLIGARIGIASLELDQMRKLDSKSAEWKKLEEDARFNLSNVLGVDSENVPAYTLYGLIYMEGFQRNKNRLDLAKLLLDEAKKRSEKYAHLQNAYGLYFMHRNALSEALRHFQAAVELDPRFVQARMNVGLTTLGFRKYDVAKEQFTKVIELSPKSYDAHIGLGAALRGLKDLDGAEAQYKKASQLEPNRGEAYYNLGVLYKDFRATKQEPAASISTYEQAKGFFRQFLDKNASAEDKAEGKEQVALIDKTIKQTQQFLKNMANQPPPPATPATPPATPPKK